MYKLYGKCFRAENKKKIQNQVKGKSNTMFLLLKVLWIFVQIKLFYYSFKAFLFVFYTFDSLNKQRNSIKMYKNGTCMIHFMRAIHGQPARKLHLNSGKINYP